MKQTIYKYKVTTISGEEIALSEYRDKTILIVNTASKCGYTPQFEGLQKLYEKFKDQGFIILGFPSNQFSDQDPGSDEEIKSFCSINYGVTFPMFSKIEVNGKNEHPLYSFLKKEASGLFTNRIKWNFTKFIVDKNGHVVWRFSPSTKPEKLEKYIKKIL